MFFIPLPIILYRLRYDRTASLLVIATRNYLIRCLSGELCLVPFAFVFGLLGFVIGDTIKIGKVKLYTFMASGLTLLIIICYTYVGAVLFLGVNIIDELINEIRKPKNKCHAIMMKYGELPENFEQQMEEMIAFYETAIPSIFIISPLVLRLSLSHLTEWLLKRLGHNVPEFYAISGNEITCDSRMVLFTCLVFALLSQT